MSGISCAVGTVRGTACMLVSVAECAHCCGEAGKAPSRVIEV
jgi:hypothetical protein